jgi:CDP-diacylglycerol--glycerol-3-phosphate 3-phosphatidyltransferase
MAWRQQLETHVRGLVSSAVKKTLARTSLTASDLTLASPLLLTIAVWFIAQGEMFWAGIAVIVVSSFDMLDGALARAKNEVSSFGAFLDSTLDRYSDALIFLGFLIYYWRVAPQSIEVILIYLAVVGTILTSYARARAEALGFSCKVGLLERPERIVLIILGLLTGWVSLTLWVLAVVTNITALQRCIHVWRQANQNGFIRPRRQLPQIGE